MKVLKNEVINNKLKRKILTSYHCKTCMLYMVETTPKEFWVSGNLLKCLTDCLKKLQKWVNVKQCPNYFISEENMFDKLARKDLKLLANALQTLLSGNLSNMLLNLSTSGIGARLRSWLHIKKFLPIAESPLLRDMINLHVKDFQQGHAIHTVLECIKPYSRQTKLLQRLRYQLDFINALLDMRTCVLVWTYSRNLKQVVENLRLIVEKFQSETRVTEHSEEEKKQQCPLFCLSLNQLFCPPRSLYWSALAQR